MKNIFLTFPHIQRTYPYVYADSIVRVLKGGGHLAPVKVEASSPQEDSPPKMEATTPTKKIKLPKIGE